MLPLNLKERIIDKSYININKVEKAYNLANKYHKGQKRKSGEDYIIHPVWIACRLCDLGADEDTIIAGLLHDTIEDTKLSLELIENSFGKEIAEIVNGLTKFSKMKYQNKNSLSKSEDFFRMILVSIKDIRVIFVKLVDRLHNIITISHLPKNKQEKIAQETLDIFIPLADILGIWEIMKELEEKCFQILNKNYYDIINNYSIKTNKRLAPLLLKTKKILEKTVKDQDISININFLKKRNYLVLKKTKNLTMPIDEIDVIDGIEIITNSRIDCYKVLGILHSLWIPRFDKMRDFISRPKPNGYSAFHTSIFLGFGTYCDVHILTKEMKTISNLGFFSLNNIKKEIVISALNEIIKTQETKIKNKEFYDEIKKSIKEKRIYVHTPKGHIIELPEKSTPIDFAYKINLKESYNLKTIKINNKLSSMGQILKNGDIVEIIFNKDTEPNLNWLKIMKSHTAKENLLQYFKNLKKEKIIEKGKEFLFHGINQFTKYNEEEINDILQLNIKKLGVKNLDDLYYKLCTGYSSLKSVLEKIFSENELLLSESYLIINNKRIPRIHIRIECYDSANLLRNIVDCISANNINIVETNSKMEKNKYYINFVLEVESFEILYDLFNHLEIIENVIKVNKV